MQVTKKYVSVARAMKDYEDKKYAIWREHLEGTLMTYLKKNLLAKYTVENVGAHSTYGEESPVLEDLQPNSSVAAMSQGM